MFHLNQLDRIGSSANAALVRSILAPTYLPEADKAPLVHEMMSTANASLFQQAHFSEAMTTYALGWQDPENYDELSEYLAPALPPSGDLFEFIEYDNAEAFLSDGAYDDLRAINGEFKTVEYTESKTQKEIPNRGLRIVLDYDRIKNNPKWQTYYTGLLLSRLKRNGYRRKVALGVAGATAASLTWGNTADPDADIANQAKLCGDSSGVQPNRALWGLPAQLLRFSSYGAQQTASALAGRQLSPVEACAKFGLAAKVDGARFQNGTGKASVVGARVLLFNVSGNSPMDPSNLKTAIGKTQTGQRYAVYIRQLTVKFWEIVVECYETEFLATPLGLRLANIS